MLGRYHTAHEVWPVPDVRAYRHEKELLYESLKIHTRDKVRWEVLDQWKEGRDQCVMILSKLREETGKMLIGLIRQEGQADLLSSISKESRQDDPVKRMTEAVLREIWQAILRDRLKREGPPFEMVVGHVGSGDDVDIKVRARDGNEASLTFIGIRNQSLAEWVTRLCNSVADCLRQSESVHSLQSAVLRMEGASDELHDMLNPVKLRPMILRTRCDLCPA